MRKLKKENKTMAEEDVFDRFTDPVRKRKKKEKEEKERKKRKLELLSIGKKFAKDFFNDSPSDQERKLWSQYVADSLPSVSELEQKLADFKGVDGLDESLINPKKKAKAGLKAAFSYLAVAYHCAGWLEQNLAALGWKTNMTNYCPSAVSHSIPEIVEATGECYKMAVKQMILLIKPM